jgi:hypothetical protein
MVSEPPSKNRQGTHGDDFVQEFSIKLQVAPHIILEIHAIQIS